MVSTLKILTDKLSLLPLKEKELVQENLKQLILSEKNTYPSKIKEYHRDNCPHCSSLRFVKNGKSKQGNQTYRCRTCDGYFSDSTGQSIHWIHLKDKWFAYVSVLFSGLYLSLSETAECIKISKKTSFRWRHKILNGLNLDLKRNFTGPVEMDDLPFTFSEKGRKGLTSPKKRGKEKGRKKPGDNDLSVKVLATLDRVDVMKLDLLRIGRLKAQDIKRSCVQDHLNLQSNILISDKHPSIKSFAKDIGVNHETFYAKQHSRKKIYHVNTINEIANRLRELINRRLNGVSTKYLQNYLNWFRMIELKKYRIMNYFDYTFRHINAWYNYHSREDIYMTFIANYSTLSKY